MSNMTDDLHRLCEADQDVALILKTFAEIERIYREALEAVRVGSRHEPGVKNSAEVTISFRPTPSSAGE